MPNPDPTDPNMLREALTVLKEFRSDLKAAHGTGDGDVLDESGLDWPDLIITYRNACDLLARAGW